MSGIGGIGGAGGGAGATGSVNQILQLRQQLVERSRVMQELRATQPGTETQGTATAPGAGFADSLRSALDSVNSAQTASSQATEAYERGETTDVAKVMLARQEAGVAFEATLQVRNKLLSAYQDIMRMGL